MSAFPPAPRARGCVATGRFSMCRELSIFFRPFRAVACVCFRQAACFPAVGKSGCLPASRQCVPSTAWHVFRLVGFGLLSGCPAAWRSTGSNYPGARRSVFSRARSCGFPAPCRCAALRLPLRESALTTVQKQGSAPASQKMNSTGRGFRALVWPSGCTIRANRRAAWLLASRQCAHPGARRLPPGEVSSTLDSGSTPVLSLLLAALVPSRRRPRHSLRPVSEA